MTDAGSHSAHVGIPEIKIGTRITNFGSHDITVSGLASGGMGLVAWGPNRAQGGQMAAVKLPRPDRLATASREQRAAILAEFEQEALTWCHLWYHPCIVTADSLLRLHALGGVPAIFLDYAPNGSLRDLLHTVHRPGSTEASGLEGVFAWGQMIAAALATIHQPARDLERPDPLVHCDLKPENVLLSAQGWAMLTDLGLTRALASLAETAPLPSATVLASGTASDLSAEQQAQVAQMRRLLAQAGVALPPNATAPALAEGAVYDTRTIYVSPAQQAALAQVASHVASDLSNAPAFLPSATAVIAQMGSRGHVAGTPPYMPPEQWLGLDAVEPASDVYALGVLLFELFAGVGGRASYPHTPNSGLLLAAGPFAAWCAAHASGPSRRLSDPEVAALSDGPLVKLWQDGQQALAEEVLAGLDALIGDCLAFAPAARPTAQRVRERLATLAEQAGVDSLSIPDFPRTPDAEATFWGNLGIVYGEMGQYEEKLRLLRKSVALTPDDLLRRETLGNALNELGRTEKESAQKARAAGDHGTAQALGAQARAHLEEAVRTFQEAEVDLTPEQLARYPHLDNTIPYNLGAALSDLGRYAEAVAARQRALATNPNDAMSYRGLALVYLRWVEEADTTPVARVERLEQAEAHARHVLKIAPHFGGALDLLATIQRELVAARRDVRPTE